MSGPQTRLDTLTKTLLQLFRNDPTLVIATRVDVTVMLHNIIKKTDMIPPGRLSLIDLPSHLIWQILVHIDARESAGVYGTCRTIRHARDRAKALSTILFRPSVLESMLFSHARNGFLWLEQLALYEPTYNGPYKSYHWANYASPFLLHSMPALRSLRLGVEPTIGYIDVESSMRTYHFPFETPGLGGFLDVPAACESTAQPMPNLQSLTIDCSVIPYQDLTVAQHVSEDPNNYHIPLGIFAHGTKLQRFFIRGIAWPEHQLVGAFKSLRSFAYAGCEQLDDERLEHFVEALPALKSLRLHISGFKDSFT